MAEEIVLNVRLDKTSAEKNIQSLTTSIVGLENENKQLRESFKKGEISAEELSLSLAKNSQAIAEQKKQRKDSINVINTENNSRKALEQAIKKNNTELRNLDTTTAKGKKRAAELTLELKKQRTQLNETKKAAGDFSSNIGQYEDALSRAHPALGGAISGMKAFTKAALTFIATPIGAVIAAIGLALGALMRYFKGSEEGQNALNKVTFVFQTILGNLDDVIQKIGKALVGMWNNPKEALQDFASNVKQFVIDRFTALVDTLGLIGKAFKQLFQGEFKEALQTAGEAGKKFITEVDPIGTLITKGIGKAKESFKELGEEMKREIGIAKGLADSQAALDLAIRKNLVQEAKDRAAIAELRAQAADKEGKSAEERLSLLDAAIKLENEILARNEKIAAEKLRIKEAQNALSNSTKEDLDEQARLEADLFNIQLTNSNARRKLESERQTALREINTELEKNTEAEIKRAEAATEKLRELRQEALLSELEDINERREKLIEFENEEFERLLENDKLLAEERELIEFEHKLRLKEIDDEYAESVIANQDRIVDGTLQAFDDILNAAGQFNDERINSAAQSAGQLLQISNDLKAGRITDEEANAASVVSITQGYTGIITGIGKEQLEQYKANKDQEVQKLIESGHSKEEAEKIVARKTAQLEIQQFKLEKASALVNAAINTAVGVTKVIANPILAAIVGALGAAQIGVIASKKPPPIPTFEKGGSLPFGGKLIKGKSHSLGGVDLFTSNGQYLGNAQGNEGVFITNRLATARLLEGVNTQSGGRDFGLSGSRFFQDGGQAEITNNITAQSLASAVSSAIRDIVVVTKVEDILTGQRNYNRVVNNGVVG